jgi:predicted N-formylglutamate amidohydrolase
MQSHPAVEFLDGDEQTLLLTCDHATNRTPPEVGDLGLPEADMTRHIAYDVGAAAVTRLLAARLGAPALLSTFSRLVIDPNRGEDDPTLVMKLYDGSVIPGNSHVDAAEVERRLDLFHRPYHRAISAWLDAALTVTEAPRIVSIHSFTPGLRGRPPRPWHVGVLWDQDDRIAGPLIARLQREPDLCVGDNEPYTGRLAEDCLNRHGTKRGLPHVLIEIRNDLIATADGQAAWAERLEPILRDVLSI